jgi:hypothetical protein
MLTVMACTIVSNKHKIVDFDHWTISKDKNKIVVASDKKLDILEAGVSQSRDSVINKYRRERLLEDRATWVCSNYFSF